MCSCVHVFMCSCVHGVVVSLLYVYVFMYLYSVEDDEQQNKIKPKERPILQIHIKKDNYNNIKTT